MKTQRIKRVLKRLGYYCPGCGRYKKTFSPPFGRRVCLRCQLDDVKGYNRGLDKIIVSREQRLMSDSVMASSLDYLKSRYLPSKEERRKDE